MLLVGHLQIESSDMCRTNILIFYVIAVVCRGNAYCLRIVSASVHRSFVMLPWLFVVLWHYYAKPVP